MTPCVYVHRTIYKQSVSLENKARSVMMACFSGGLLEVGFDVDCDIRKPACFVSFIMRSELRVYRTEFRTTAEPPFYCGHLGDLVKCPV